LIDREKLKISVDRINLAFKSKLQDLDQKSIINQQKIVQNERIMALREQQQKQEAQIEFTKRQTRFVEPSKNQVMNSILTKNW